MQDSEDEEKIEDVLSQAAAILCEHENKTEEPKEELGPKVIINGECETIEAKEKKVSVTETVDSDGETVNGTIIIKKEELSDTKPNLISDTITEPHPDQTEPNPNQTELNQTQTELNTIQTEPEVIEKEPEIVEKEPEIVEREPEIVKTEPEFVEKEPKIIEKEPEIVQVEPEVVELEPEKDKIEPEKVRFIPPIPKKPPPKLPKNIGECIWDSLPKTQNIAPQPQDTGTKTKKRKKVKKKKKAEVVSEFKTNLQGFD